MSDNIFKKPASLFEFRPVKLTGADLKFDGYESPIHLIMGQLQTEFAKQGSELDKMTYKAIQSVGIEVDKDELIRALQYDRDQYNAGYRTGYYKGQQDKWKTFPPPDEAGRYTVTRKDGTVGRCYYGQDERGVWMWYDTNANPVIAWLENPAPYRRFDYD